MPFNHISIIFQTDKDNDDSVSPYIIHRVKECIKQVEANPKIKIEYFYSHSSRNVKTIIQAYRSAGRKLYEMAAELEERSKK